MPVTCLSVGIGGVLRRCVCAGAPRCQRLTHEQNLGAVPLGSNLPPQQPDVSSRMMLHATMLHTYCFKAASDFIPRRMQVHARTAHHSVCPGTPFRQCWKFALRQSAPVAKCCGNTQYEHVEHAPCSYTWVKDDISRSIRLTEAQLACSICTSRRFIAQGGQISL